MIRDAWLLLLNLGLLSQSPFCAGFLGISPHPFVHPKIQNNNNKRHVTSPINRPLSSTLVAPDPSTPENVPSSALPNIFDNRPEQELFKDLSSLVNLIDDGLLRLDKDPDSDVRGVFVNREVDEGEALLSIPLSFCLRDDEPPQWIPDQMRLPSSDDCDDNSIDDDDDEIWHRSGLWASRLAASVLDSRFQMSKGDSEDKAVRRLWFSLLPDPSFLRASLPVNWSETVLSKTKCTALELSVDSSYFSRAQAVHDLAESLVGCKEAESLDAESKRFLVNNALDLVQTRTCRVNAVDGTPIRLFAPIFDLINHDCTKVNAEFALENEKLVVRATKNIPANAEIIIDYGASARPDWLCLNSYGFVPSFRPGIPFKDGDFTAEVFLEGRRFEVGPDSVSEDLVFAMAEAMGEAGDPEHVCLTPNIALRLAQRLAEAAFQILLPDDDNEDTFDDSTGDDEDDELSAVELESPETVISERLAASLRWNQHRILMTCSLGLRDWAMKQK